MENIEAMLCAYIEGDLDEAGRAQIEKHLQEHPQHRKLIAALTTTRDLMRDLPRAKAPADVGEWLHGQVERSILLDDSDMKTTAQRAKPSRWPQLLGVAAVLLLFASLGIIVMKMVMPTFTPPVSPTAATIKMPTSSQAQTEDQVRDESKANGPVMANDLLLSKAPPSQAVPQEIPPAPFDVNAVRQRLASSGYAANANGIEQTAPVVLVINSSNRSTTDGQITQYLNRQSGISWRQVPDESVQSPGQTPQLNQLAAARQQSLAASPLPAQPSATQPASPLASASYAAQNNRAQNGYLGDALRTLEKKDSENLSAPPTTQPATDMYVAQGMTVQQADELRQSLASQPDVQACRVYKQMALDVPATQPGANADLVLGERQETLKPTIPADQLVVTGGLTPPTTQPTTAPAIADTTNLPAGAPAGLAGKAVGGGGSNSQMAVANVDAVIVVQPAAATPPAPSTEPAATSPSASTQP